MHLAQFCPFCLAAVLQGYGQNGHLAPPERRPSWFPIRSLTRPDLAELLQSDRIALMLDAIVVLHE